MKILVAILTSLATAHAVQLAWDPLNHPDVDGYILHFGPNPTTPSQHVSTGNVTTAAVEGLPAGNTIYFVCTAHATTGEESGPSNQVAFVVPTPTPIPTPTPSRFKVGDRIVLKGNTNVRSTPGIANNLVGMNPIGTSGTLIEGPASGPGAIEWWKVDYDGGAFDGWSGEDNFMVTSVPVPTPTPLPTPTPVPTPTPTPVPTPPVVVVPAHTHTWDEITGKPASFTPAPHTHQVPEVTTQ